MQFCPSYYLVGSSHLPLDVGYHFLVGPNILLSMVVQQWVWILEFLLEKMSAHPSTLPSYSLLYSSSVYSCHLFLISPASIRSILILFFIVPICAWNVQLVSLILLKRSLDFPILLFSSISLHWSLRKAFLSLLAILWNSAFKWVYLLFSFAFSFSSFHSYLWGFLRQSFCL